MTAEDVKGRAASWADLLGPAQSLLLIFTSPRCGPCRAFMPEVRDWQRRLSGQLRIVLASDGSADEVRHEAAEFGLADMLVDRELALFHAFGARGTPGAVLITTTRPLAASSRADTRQSRQLVAGEIAASANGSPEIRVAVTEPGMSMLSLPLRRLAGETVTLPEIIQNETMVFWNPGCGYCRAIHADIRRSEQNRPAKAPHMVVVSSGDEASVRAEGFEAPVVLDPDFAFGRVLGIGGTPMAVLVDAHARLASAPAAGREAVLAPAGAREGRSAGRLPLVAHAPAARLTRRDPALAPGP
jgi:thiol-disulfide isomerase/thioredoxin